MRSCIINLEKLLVGDTLYPKGMYNSELPFLATSQPASIMNVFTVFQVTPPEHRMMKKRLLN
jgi:hypothetical protein